MEKNTILGSPSGHSGHVQEIVQKFNALSYDQLRRLLEDARHEIEALEARTTRQQQIIGQLSNENCGLKDQNQTAKQELQDAKHVIEALRASTTQLTTQQQIIDQLSDENCGLKDQNQTAKQELQDTQQALQNAERKINWLTLDTTQLAAQQGQIEQLLKENYRLGDQNQTTAQALDETTQALERKKQECNELDRIIQTLKQNIKSKEKEHENLYYANQKLQEALKSEIEKRDNLHHTIHQLTHRLQSKTQQYDALNSTKQKLQEDLNSKTRQYNSLKHTVQKLEEQLKSHGALVSSLAEQITNLKQEKQELQDQYNALLERQTPVGIELNTQLDSFMYCEQRFAPLTNDWRSQNNSAWSLPLLLPPSPCESVYTSPNDPSLDPVSLDDKFSEALEWLKTFSHTVIFPCYYELLKKYSEELEILSASEFKKLEESGLLSLSKPEKLNVYMPAEWVPKSDINSQYVYMPAEWLPNTKIQIRDHEPDQYTIKGMTLNISLSRTIPGFCQVLNEIECYVELEKDVTISLELINAAAYCVVSYAYSAPNLKAPIQIIDSSSHKIVFDDISLENWLAAALIVHKEKYKNIFPNDKLTLEMEYPPQKAIEHFKDSIEIPSVLLDYFTEEVDSDVSVASDPRERWLSLFALRQSKQDPEEENTDHSRSPSP